MYMKVYTLYFISTKIKMRLFRRKKRYTRSFMFRTKNEIKILNTVLYLLNLKNPIFAFTLVALFCAHFSRSSANAFLVNILPSGEFEMIVCTLNN